MRIERVEAVAFGPLSGRRLDLAEAMTVVFGPNEAGKSSFEAALLAGVCGVRRGRGRRHSGEERFEERHRPWHGEEWRVRAVVALAGGRRVELDQDLAARTGTARDAASGRELTAEILTDQTPDASRFLGIDRYAFEAVAWVAQGEILAIRRGHGRLAEHLQRAAATAGAQGTAAEGLRRVDELLVEQVGTERAATRPLARAIAERAAAEQALAAAGAAHLALAGLTAELGAARRLERAAARRLRASEAAIARHLPPEGRRAADDAGELAGRQGAPGLALRLDDARARRAHAAVEAWSTHPEPAALDGPSAAELAAELAALPAEPEGDLEPHGEVEAAAAELDAARTGLAVRAGTAAPGGGPRLRWPLAAATAAGVAGLAVAAAGGGGRAAWVPAVAGVAGLAVALALALGGTAAARRRRGSHARGAAGGGDARVAAGAARLAAALAARGAPASGDPGGDLAGYRQACARRAELARRAARHADLALRVEDRRRAEEQLAAATDRRRALEQELRSSAGACGCPDAAGADPAALAEALRSWLDRRGEALGRWEAAGREQAKLEALVAGRRDEHQAAASAASVLEARLAERRAGTVLVAEAEEALVAAEERLERLRRLEAVLSRTRRLLALAQEEVHRSVAPLLSAAMTTALPVVTAGRYHEIRVDPGDLTVRVRTPEGDWREAEMLSRGTAEQVYLLLRAALAEHLALPGEPCPLVLDDPIAAADPDRARALLEVLHQLAAVRQVVVFTHDERARAWAVERLRPPRDRLVELPPPPASAPTTPGAALGLLAGRAAAAVPAS